MSRTDSQQNLGTDDTADLTIGVTTAEFNEETESDQEENATEDDEWFESTDADDEHTEGGSGKDGSEGVEGGDTGGREDALVESDDEDGVEVITLHVPSYRHIKLIFRESNGRG